MPTVPLSPRPFLRDARGNRLLRWTVVDEAGGHELWLCGPFEVADQVKSVDPRYQSLTMSEGGRQQAWTHVLRASGPVSPDCTVLLQTLAQIVILPCPDNIEVALTLDWYKVPDPQVDPFEWPNTETAELLNQGKYRSRSNPDRQAHFGRALADRIASTINGHPLLKRSTVVVDVPGHDSEQVSFGSRLAASVAVRLGVPMRRTSAVSTFRPPAKSSHSDTRAAAINGQFIVQNDLSFSTALIVDDVYRSGTSMAETARAARIAGAQTVYGISAVRTMRGR